MFTCKFSNTIFIEFQFSNIIFIELCTKTRLVRSHNKDQLDYRDLTFHSLITSGILGTDISDYPLPIQLSSDSDLESK